jgi:hypothetical protein
MVHVLLLVGGSPHWLMLLLVGGRLLMLVLVSGRCGVSCVYILRAISNGGHEHASRLGVDLFALGGQSPSRGGGR